MNTTNETTKDTVQPVAPDATPWGAPPKAPQNPAAGKIPGYREISPNASIIVTGFKETEERLLRLLDVLKNDPLIDQRWLAIGRTDIEKAFMAINRSVFRPTRIPLKEDFE